MVTLVCERGLAAVTVTAVCERAHVSRRSFYDRFLGREDCFLAIQDRGYREASRLIEAAFSEVDPGDLGPDVATRGVRSALAALLSWLEGEPQLARVWLVESLASGPRALERRELHIAALTEQIVGHWGLPVGAGGHRLAAPAVMASVMGLIHRHLVHEARQPLLTLLGPLMGVVTAPYLGEHAVREQVRLGEQHAHRLLAARACSPPRPHARLPPRPQHDAAAGCGAMPQLPRALTDPRAHRLRRALCWLAQNPGASNRQVADATGIASHAQASALLLRLQQMGLLSKRTVGAGYGNAWSVTERGRVIAQRLRG